MLLSGKHLFKLSTSVGDFICLLGQNQGNSILGNTAFLGFIASDTFEAADLGPSKLWLSFHSFCELI